MKKTVLIVDDDADFLLPLEVRLSNAGFEVLTAQSAQEAEEKLAETRPDLCVVDLMMEHMDAGFALCYHIKKKDPSIGVILVTGVASETGLEFDTATADERAWIKADAILTKPVRFEQLEREIERLLKD